MNIKKNLSLSFAFAQSLVLISAFSPTTINAKMMTGENSEQSKTMMVRAASYSARVETRTGAMMEKASSSANREIDRRIAALTHLTTRITSMNRLSNEQKASLISQVQSAISDLQALRAKINSDADPVTLKANKQSIASSYRVFLLLVPKIEILANADKTLQLAEQMSSNSVVIQTRIDESKATGTDVSGMTTALNNRNTKIADAKRKAQNAIDSVIGLTPEGYPANKAALLSGRDTLKAARQDLAVSYQDLNKMNAKMRK